METWKARLIGTMNQSATEWHFGSDHAEARGREGTKSACNAIRLLITSLLFNLNVISDLGNELRGPKARRGAAGSPLGSCSVLFVSVSFRGFSRRSFSALTHFQSLALGKKWKRTVKTLLLNRAFSGGCLRRPVATLWRPKVFCEKKILGLFFLFVSLFFWWEDVMRFWWKPRLFPLSTLSSCEMNPCV